jgi:hypothetical protein
VLLLLVEGWFQEAAPAVAKHLRLCNVMVGEDLPEVRVASYVVPKGRRIVNADRSLHDVEAEQAIGVLFEPVDYGLRRFLDLAA